MRKSIREDPNNIIDKLKLMIYQELILKLPKISLESLIMKYKRSDIKLRKQREKTNKIKCFSFLNE